MNLPARHRLDVACALALSLLSGALALWADDQVRRSGPTPRFYQEEFAPAVLFACGKGFHNVDWVNHDPAMAAFLYQTRDGLACNELARRPLIPSNGFQSISLYLELAVGFTWRLAGISWSVVVWLDALLAAFFAAMVYGVMRLGMRPLFAAILSAIVVTSPLHLSYVLELRDYSKAPFLLALVLLMGIAVKRPLSRRQLLGLALLGGIVAGVGFGFRTDILLATVPFLVVLFVFRAGSPPMRSRLIEGATASALFVATFALTTAPVLRGYAGGGNFGHVILLGFSSPFNPALGVEAKHYELSALYNDGYQEAVVRSYTSRVSGDTRNYSIASEKYDRESNRYLMTVIRTFPADVAIRALGSVVQTLEAPFSPRYTRPPGWVPAGSARRVYDRRADALDRVQWLGWAVTTLVVAGMAAWSIRCAAFLVFLIAFLGGGAAIQFEPRHFFYLEFMSWWMVGVTVDRALAAGRTAPRLFRDTGWLTRQWLAGVGAGVARSAAVVVVCLLGMTVALRATRHYQQQRMDRLFEQALSSAGPPLRMAHVPNGADRVTVTLDLPELDLVPEAWRARSIGTAYLLVDVNPERCDSWNFFALARYRTISEPVDFTTPVTVPLIDTQLGSSVKILLPVYSALFFSFPPTRFIGIELPASQASCIASISKVEHLDALPVLMSAVLGPDWRTASHYQTMIRVERREDGVPFRVRLYPTFPTLEVRRSIVLQPATDPWPRAVFTSRVAVPAPASGLIVDGRPEASYAYLLISRVRAISRGTCAVADGALAVGGLTFGIVRDGQWYQRVNIGERGRFLAAGCALEDGNYSIVLANNNPAGGVTTARLEKIGWVGADPELHTFPPSLVATAKQFTRTKAIFQGTDLMFQAGIARASPSGWTIKGTADGSYSYLLASKPQIVADDRLLFAAGSITRGGLTIGLVRDGAWAAQVNVTDVGAFTAVIQPPGAGTYDVIVANNLPNASRETEVAISKMAWMGR